MSDRSVDPARQRRASVAGGAYRPCEGGSSFHGGAQLVPRHSHDGEKALLAKVGPGQTAPSGSFSNAPQAYWLSWQRVDPLVDAKALSMPMLFLQGGRFPGVAYAGFRALEGDAGQPVKHRVPLVSRLSHLFTPAGKTGTIADYATPSEIDAQVIADIATWIKAQPSTHGKATTAAL